MEQVTDLTSPDVDMINKRAGKLIDEFKELVFPAGYDPGSTATKRKVMDFFSSQIYPLFTSYPY